MESVLYHLANSHSKAFIVGAASICAITAWLLLSLLERATASKGASWLPWVVAVAVVGGLGVWTTHFIAMLGFRPDFPFGYDPSITAFSALIGIVLIGLPLACTALTKRQPLHVICGAIAGAGVAAMHFTGMGALQGCSVTHVPSISAISTFLGICLFAGALSIRDKRRYKCLVVALIFCAVWLVHFIALIGMSLEPLAGFVSVGVDRVTLGAVVMVSAVCLLITASISAVSSTKLEQQTQQGALLGAALANMSNGLLVVGINGRISLLNDRLLQLFAISERHVAVGMRWQDYLLNLGLHLGWGAARIQRVIDNHSAWFAKEGTTYLEHALDDGRVISVACRPMGSGGAVLTYDDISGEREAQKALERLAFVDPLTDLANRRAFKQELEAALQDGEKIALLLIDLDRFKSINDTLGHAVGDELLIEVGNRLRAACSDDEFAYRLGGDELALISRRTNDVCVTDLAAKIVADIAKPFSILEHTINTGCSIGISTTDDTRDAAALNQYADLAMFRAKARGRRQTQRYEAGMQEAATERRHLEANLRDALNGGQLSLLYQPLCRLPDLRIVGFEALIRWNHPERGAISPARFIPVAEETGIIHEIGQWVLTEACREAATWPLDVHVAVNASPVQLRSEVFSLQVVKTLASCGLDPKRLEIELTETALVEDGDQIAVSLNSMRKLGIRVAMDDFGTGYSSFAHLVDFDLDSIKIDRSFVQAAPENSSAMAVVKAVIQMAHDLNVSTIGEGVETVEQMNLLKQLGCDAVQGYLLGRPMAPSKARELLAAHEGRVREGDLSGSKIRHHEVFRPGF